MADLEDAKTVSDAEENIAKTATDGLVVQNYCNQVLQQPSMTEMSKISGMPDIDTYLSTAKQNASLYLYGIQPRIIEVVADVGGFSRQFPSFIEGIEYSRKSWASGNIDAKQDMLELLRHLRSDIEIRKKNVEQVAGSITGTSIAFSNDAANFNDVYSKSEARLLGDKGIIKQYEEDIAHLNKIIRDTTIGTVVSAVAIVGGIAMIVVGAIASIPTGGATVPLIVGGSLLTVAGAVGLGVSASTLAKSVAQRKDLYGQISNLKAELAMLGLCRDNIGILRDSATSAVESLTRMSNTWNILSGELGQVIYAVENASKESNIPVLPMVYLNTASSQWKKVDTTIDNIKRQMTDVKTVTLTKSNKELEEINEKTFNEDSINRLAGLSAA